ncbi:MAG: endonuclease/exonuclease/phosphatase family protein [Deltaproteobacteria bacterium]|nr:endonuclease/exonuclease/phosphatase family protein [Deltaproteobacteria bacterium]
MYTTHWMVQKLSDNWKGCRTSVGLLGILSFLLLSTKTLPLLARQIEKSEISIMTYNVENLFDATDDGVKQEDPAYLPMEVKKRWMVNKCLSRNGFYRMLCEELDWTQEKYEAKLQKIAKVLLDYNSGGADVISFEELENRRVITDLWRKYLKPRGYRTLVHFESASARGIDVGIVSRFPLASAPIVHSVDLSDIDDHPTRDIVEARFHVEGGKQLRIAANHWPSQNNSTEARLRAAAVIKTIATKAQSQGTYFVAMGDFNTLPEELPNPIEDNVADNVIRNQTHPLVDIQNYLGLQWGSYFYKGKWQPLDRFLASKNLFGPRSPMKVNLASFSIFSPAYLLKKESILDPQTGKMKEYVIPFRYDAMTGEGYSDHLPIVLKITQD